MGKLLPGYRTYIVDELVNSFNNFYTFAANPITEASIPEVTGDDYSTLFTNDWQILFGKRVKSTDVLPIVKNNKWTVDTVYAMYDNTKDMSNGNFYVVTSPNEYGGYYHFFTCVNNANNNPSLYKPDLIQQSSFTKSDGYTWRYITSIGGSDYVKFATDEYIPIYANTTVSSDSLNHSGVEVVMISNSGSGYSSYHDGTIQSVTTSTLIQIDSGASNDRDFYTNNSIYIYNDNSPTADLIVITAYESNNSGKWVSLQDEANTSNILPGRTKYKISPRVVFQTDGDTQPKAYTIVNTSVNSISNVVIVDTGSQISWANVYLQSNSVYGTGANLYCIVPPPGGHGANPASELHVTGFSLATKFANTETDTIPVGITYNKIGVLVNPYQSVLADGSKSTVKYQANTFSAVLEAVPLSGVTFSIGTKVKGVTSNSIGTVAFSNTSLLMLTGDKSFVTNEYISTLDGLSSTQITINSYGDVYTKDLRPIYVQNISNVTRSNTQSESFKLLVQI